MMLTTSATYSSGSTSTAAAWSYWNNTLTATANPVTYTTNAVWVYWVQTDLRVSAQVRVTAQEFEPLPETEEQKAARQKALIENAERLKKETEIKERAMKLLREHLSEGQRKHFDKHGVIPIITKNGNIYRISKGIAGNINRLDRNGKVIERLCVHPDGVPEGDAMLSQLLWLEWNEEELRNKANITRIAA